MHAFLVPDFSPLYLFSSPPLSSPPPSVASSPSSPPFPSPPRFLPAPPLPEASIATGWPPPLSPSPLPWPSASPSWFTVFVPQSISGSAKASKPIFLSPPPPTSSPAPSNPSIPRPKLSPSPPPASAPSAPTAKSDSFSMASPANWPPADSKSCESTIPSPSYPPSLVIPMSFVKRETTPSSQKTLPAVANSN